MAQHPHSAQSNGSHGGHGSHGESHEAHGSLKSYVIGFVLSIILTIIPIVLVLNDIVEGTAAYAVLFATAILQFVVQLFFFMHLKEEASPRWNLMTLLLGLMIVLIIIVGSIWIMLNNQVTY